MICGRTDRCVVDELGVIPIHYLKAGSPRSAVIGCKSRVPAKLRFSLAEIAVLCNIYFRKYLNYLNYQIYEMEHFLSKELSLFQLVFCQYNLKKDTGECIRTYQKRIKSKTNLTVLIYGPEVKYR